MKSINKELVFIIKWTVPPEYAGTLEEVLETLRGVGAADVVNVEVVEVKK